MAKGDPLLSPYVWDSGADYLGRHISISVPFDESTRAILDGAVIHRDPGCIYTSVVVGVPTDAGAERTGSVPDGDTLVSATQILAIGGFSTIDQILALQMTAEP